MLTVQYAVGGLQKYLPQDAGHCISRLQGIIVPAEGYRALREHYPQGFENVATRQYSMQELLTVTGAIEHICSEFGKLFPISDWMAEQLWEGDSFRIVIEPMGLQMNWDDFSDDLENPSNLSENAGPDMLIQCLIHGIDYDDWRHIIDYFGWDVKPFKYPDYRWYFEEDEIYDELDAMGCRDLIPVWQLNCWDTGTIFLDMNMSDEMTYTMNMFDPDQIPHLVEQKKLADEHLVKYSTGSKMIMNDPTLIQKQVDLFLRCLHAREKD